MTDKLAEIMAAKEKEISSIIRPVHEAELSRLAENASGSFRLKEKLESNSYLSVIAEIKRRSPSAGVIAENIKATDQAIQYYNAGADALSILTEKSYFGGEMSDLWQVTDLLRDHQRAVPCLRKDFMLHPIQVVEAAEAGAAAILIIVRALTDDSIHRLYDAANLAGLDSLFEIHCEAELERALDCDAKIIGVNNRDLKNFRIDLSLSERLIPQISDGIIPISESGIRNQDDANRVLESGAKAILVGETLMKENSLDDFIPSLQHCGSR